MEVLERAGVDRCSAVITVTDNDATNLSVGLSAKKMNPSLRAVTRIFDAAFARKVEGVLNIDAALSASKLSAPSFVAAALGEGLVYSFVEDGVLKVIRDDGGRLGFEEMELT
jgi:voltage-gated potassium channel Kch